MFLFSRSLVLAALTLSCAASVRIATAGSPAGEAATAFSDFAFEVKDATGEYYTGWVVDKLTTFHVSKACMDKMVDKKNGAVPTATGYTRSIGALAKALTGDDWGGIEGQANQRREETKKLVEPMIEKFKASYSLSITVEGDDCDVKRSALWLHYWNEIGSVLKANPPASGKAFVKLVVKPGIKTLTVDVDDKKSTYTVTAPRDIEMVNWTGALEKPFRKRARPQ